MVVQKVFFKASVKWVALVPSWDNLVGVYLKTTWQAPFFHPGGWEKTSEGRKRNLRKKMTDIQALAHFFISLIFPFFPFDPFFLPLGPFPTPVLFHHRFLSLLCLWLKFSKFLGIYPVTLLCDLFCYISLHYRKTFSEDSAYSALYCQ